MRLATLTDGTAELAAPLVVLLAVAGLGDGAAGLGARFDPWTARVGARGVCRLRRADRPLRTGDVRGLHEARRHGDWLATLDTCSSTGPESRASPRRPTRRRSARLVMGYPIGVVPLGDRGAGRRRSRLGLPAVPRVPGRAARARALRADRGVVRSHARAVAVTASPPHSSTATRRGAGSRSSTRGPARAARRDRVLAWTVRVRAASSRQSPRRRSRRPERGGVVWLVRYRSSSSSAPGAAGPWRTSRSPRRARSRSPSRRCRRTRRSSTTPRVARGADDSGNLFGPLSPWQIFGIWPSGDFRVRPDHSRATIVLVVVASRPAPRRASPPPPGMGAAPAVASAVIGAPCSTSRRALDRGEGACDRLARVLAAGARGGATLVESGRRIEGARPRGARRRRAWSNALASADAHLAPRASSRSCSRSASVRRRGAGPDDRVPALRGPALPPAARPRGRLGAPARPVPLRGGRCSTRSSTPIDAFAPEASSSTGRSCSAAPGPGGPALAVHARRARALLRRVAAAGAGGHHAPGVPGPLESFSSGTTRPVLSQPGKTVDLERVLSPSVAPAPPRRHSRSGRRFESCSTCCRQRWSARGVACALRRPTESGRAGPPVTRRDLTRPRPRCPLWAR